MSEWEVSGVKRPNLVGFPSYRLKLIRALEHLGELYAATQVFSESGAFAVSVDQDSDTGEHVVSVTLRSQPTTGISMLAADCLHNMRQALDHLAYDLAILASGEDPPPNEDTAMFPVYTGIREGQAVVLDDDRLRSKIGDPAKVPANVQAILEDLQPHYGGDRLKLAILQDLENAAKHRFLPICAGSVRPRATTADHIDVTSITEGPLEIGKTEVGRFRMSEPKMYMQGAFQIEVTFAEPPVAGQIVTQYIAETRTWLLERVIRPLEAILAPPSAGPAP